MVTQREALVATISAEDRTALTDSLHRLLADTVHGGRRAPDDGDDGGLRRRRSGGAGRDGRRRADRRRGIRRRRRRPGGAGAGDGGGRRGAALRAADLVSGVLAAGLLRALGDEAAKSRLLPGIAAGTTHRHGRADRREGRLDAEPTWRWPPRPLGRLDAGRRRLLRHPWPDRGRAPGRGARARTGSRVFEVEPGAGPGDQGAADLRPHAAAGRDRRSTDAPARRLASTGRPGQAVEAGARPRPRGAGRRTGRRRAAGAGVHGRLRQDPRPVRPR